MNSALRLLFGMAATLSAATAQIPITACAADGEMTVGPIPQGYFDSRSSNGTAYYTKGCFPEYSVDITVPGSLTGPLWKNLTIGGYFDHWFLLTEQTCQYASQSVVILKRTFGSLGWSPWQPYAQVPAPGKPASGKWVTFTDTGNPYCALSSAIRIAPPSAGFTDQYRVKVLPTLYGSPVQAGVNWGLSQ